MTPRPEQRPQLGAVVEVLRGQLQAPPRQLRLRSSGWLITQAATLESGWATLLQVRPSVVAVSPTLQQEGDGVRFVRLLKQSAFDEAMVPLRELWAGLARVTCVIPTAPGSNQGLRQFAAWSATAPRALLR